MAKMQEFKCPCCGGSIEFGQFCAEDEVSVL